jgi:hypothetical protein
MLPRAPSTSPGQALILGPCAALRVRRGALDIEHGTNGSKQAIRIDIDDSKPHTILFDSYGEFLTGEALRWCARYGIGLILPDGPSRMMTFLHSALGRSDDLRNGDSQRGANQIQR